MRFGVVVTSVLALACGSSSNGAQDGDTGADTSAGSGSTDDGSDPSSGAPSSTTSLDETSADASSGSEDSSTGDTPSDCPEPPAEPPCDATGGGRCFYIDPIAGDDLADGSAGAPWRTFVNIDSSIYYGTYPPTPQWIALAPGDIVYVGDGTITSIFHPGDDSGPEGGGSYLLYFRGLEASVDTPITITRLPGARPILQPEADAIPILVQQSRGVVIDGFEVVGGYGRGIRLEES
ncbi:MAG TPA: hypothetical protein VG755_13415, partial [Nannocystaceae bacterium]|nr:hypothetical protein [Nannocystaceae bacterium]